MTREEFCTPENYYMIRHVYNIFLQMQEKYSHLEEENYNFQFFNFRGTGQNITMQYNYFSVHNNGEDHEYPIFEILKTDDADSLWEEFELTHNSFTWYNGLYRYDLCIDVGDHKTDVEKRYIVCDYNSEPEEVFEKYGEEYFFQQLTVQNIIPYEQFQREVKWFYKYLVPNLLHSDIIIRIDLDSFNIKTLEGFRVI